MKTDIDLSLVSDNTLNQAVTLIHKIFPKTTPREDPDLWFKLSTDPQKFADQIKDGGCRDVRYFVATDKETGQVIGTTGLYHMLEDPQSVVWLGWFCVDPQYRRQGIGTYLLNWTIEKAKQENESKLLLYTSEEESPEAQILYAKFGFKTTKTQIEDGNLVTYKELQL